jgi:hypothetical protein
MGKKKSSQNHLQQSMGNMVSRAALVQMGPDIEKIVRHHVNHLGNQLAVQQASTLETLFSRVVVLESIVMEKLGYTSEDLTRLVSNKEDEAEGLARVDGAAEAGDVVRLEIRTKTKDQAVYQGSSRLKINQIGSGQTIGPELESAVLGMKAGETKEVEFGTDKAMTAEIKIDRISRAEKSQAATQGDENASQSEG